MQKHLKTGAILLALLITSLIRPALAVPVFGNRTDHDPGGGPLWVGAADVDGDGDQDIVATIDYIGIVVFRNDGTGGFPSVVPPEDRMTLPFYPALGGLWNLDGDSSVELVILKGYGPGLTVFDNDGAGHFIQGSTYNAGSCCTDVAAGDFDSDGDLDLVSADMNADNVTVLFNAGGLNFVPDNPYSAGSRPRSVQVGDFDNDSDLDFAVSKENSHNVTIFLNNGSGQFTQGNSYPAGGSPWMMGVGDLDLDGRPDLAIAQSGRDSVYVLLNGASSANGYAVHGTGTAVTLADFDMDGHVDVATANYDPSNVSILVNNVGGGFLPYVDFPLDIPPGFGPYGICSADLDDDGDTDLAVANLNGSRIQVLRNLHAPPPPCDTLRIDPVKLYYGPDGCRAPVNLTNCTPLKGATIPLKYDPLPTGWHSDSVSFIGARMADWDVKQDSVNPVERMILIDAIVDMNGTGKTVEPAGSGPLFYLWFSGPTSGYTCDELVDTICVDTTTIPRSPSPGRLLFVGGLPAQEFVPIVVRGCVYLHHFRIVDFNCDGDLDVFDLVTIIDYVFSGGPCLSVCDAGDVNGDGVVDVFDVVAAIDCVFSGGLCPVCFDAAPAPALAKRVPAEAVADIQTASLNGTDWMATLSVQSPAPWRAAQLEWTFDGPVDQLSVSIDEGAAGLKTYWHLDGQQLKVGLIDIRGEALIAAGSLPVLRISGSGDFPGVRLTDGVLVDQNNQGISVSPVAAAGAILGVPSSFSLGANYPNPFNAGTVIHYTLGRDGQATVTVFDILGRHVATLVDEFQSAGPHEVAWNGTDAHGRAAASGMYFYRLTAGGFADSKKMVLLK